MNVDLRDAIAAAWSSLRCWLGFHAKPVGLIDWLAPYNPESPVLHYRNFLGCPRCRREAKPRELKR